MKSLAQSFSIIVWHRDPVRGTHQSVLMEEPTADKVLTRFSNYLRKIPVQLRSFNPSSQVQLHGPNGKIADLPHIAS